MMIFQMYEDKGRHIAYTRQEAKKNEENGYVTVTKKQFYDIKRYPSVENLDDPVEVDEPKKGNPEKEDDMTELKMAYENKFGKPPRRAMKAAGIKKALED